MKNLKSLVLAALLLIPFFGASAATSLFGEFEGKEDYDRLWALVENYEFKGGESATDEEKWEELKAAIDAELTYDQAGSNLLIADGKVSVNVLPGYTFLSKGEALFIYEAMLQMELTNDRKESIHGILVSNGTFFDKNSIFTFVEYIDVGYVSVEDAAAIDGEMMAQELEKQMIDENKNKGNDEIKLENLIWIQKPIYDSSTHIFTYANYFNEVYQSEVGGTTINANTIMLGRAGYINSIVVANEAQREFVDTVSSDLNKMVSFSAGNTYADYNPETDKKSDLTIAGIAAGAVGIKALAKLGVWAVVAKFGKFIVLGVILFYGKIKNGIRKMRGLEVEEKPTEEKTTESTPEATDAEKSTDLPSNDTK